MDNIQSKANSTQPNGFRSGDHCGPYRVLLGGVSVTHKITKDWSLKSLVCIHLYRWFIYCGSTNCLSGDPHKLPLNRQKSNIEIFASFVFRFFLVCSHHMNEWIIAGSLKQIHDSKSRYVWIVDKQSSAESFCFYIDLIKAKKHLK